MREMVCVPGEKCTTMCVVPIVYSRTSELRNPRETRVSVSLKFP